MYLLGYDIGSSSVKACLVNAATGKIVASDFFPKEEMKITAVKSGWAEQDPADWWANLKLRISQLCKKQEQKVKIYRQ
jgi:xylulokinase